MIREAVGGFVKRERAGVTPGTEPCAALILLRDHAQVAGLAGIAGLARTLAVFLQALQAQPGEPNAATAHTTAQAIDVLNLTEALKTH
jgi:hypothetical protein